MVEYTQKKMVVPLKNRTLYGVGKCEWQIVNITTANRKVCHVSREEV